MKGAFTMMHLRFCSRFFLVLLSTCCTLLLVSNARAQFNLETCEDLKVTEAHYGINTVETATCINPTKTFSPKGAVQNINILYSVPKVPTGSGVTFMVT